MRPIDVLLSGAERPGDAGNSWDSLPEWFSRDKFDRGRKLIHGNACSNYFSTNIGVVLMSQTSSLMDPLIDSGNLCSIAKAQTRMAHTFQYVLGWNVGDVFDSEDEAHRTLKLVKGMHSKVSERMNSRRPLDGSRLWVSQLDMALTQFSIVGAIMLFPKKIGVYLEDDDLELVAHFWRTIGYLLGVEDRFNLCTGTYREIHELCWAIVEEIAKPALMDPKPVYDECLYNAVTGLKKFASFIDYVAFCNWSFDLIGLPRRFPSTVYGNVCMMSWKLTVGLLYYDRFRTTITPVYRKTLNRRISKHTDSLEKTSPDQEGLIALAFSYVASLVSQLKKVVVPKELQRT